MGTARRIKTCKHCNKAYLVGVEKKLHPFCSEHCKLNDLYDWLSGNHSIPGKPVHHTRLRIKTSPNES